MKTTWFNHLKEKEQQEEFKRLIKACQPVLERLSSLLGDKLEKVSKEQDSLDIYNSPNWEYLQVDYNSQRRVYKELLKLLEI